MESLFDENEKRARASVAPLASRMRPRSLDEFVGQQRAVGEGTWLRRAIENDALSSVVLFGPAGTGKTSLARIVADVTHAHFEEVSAITSGVADLRKAIEAATSRLAMNDRRTILFIDEIHRFSKSQQDALLHAVEDRVVVLIGATTENPLFEVNAPLVSRSRIIELQPLSDENVATLIGRALSEDRGFAGKVTLEQEALEAIIRTAGGDARVALTTLELAAECALSSGMDVARVTLKDVAEANPTRILPYDKGGDVHYDVASALIKSMRGSDPDAAVYWLARMLHGGEDPKFIARRMVILASEDIGNADPMALLVAQAAFRSVELIGLPECRINLSQAAIYLAMAPKSNAAYIAIDTALDEVRNGPARAVPSHLRDRHRPGSNAYDSYIYPHDHPERAKSQRYLPEGLERGVFYDAPMDARHREPDARDGDDE